MLMWSVYEHRWCLNERVRMRLMWMLFYYMAKRNRIISTYHSVYWNPNICAKSKCRYTDFNRRMYFKVTKQNTHTCKTTHIALFPRASSHTHAFVWMKSDNFIELFLDTLNCTVHLSEQRLHAQFNSVQIESEKSQVSKITTSFPCLFGGMSAVFYMFMALRTATKVSH